MSPHEEPMAHAGRKAMDAQQSASQSTVASAHPQIDVQSVIADVSRALNEALRDERTNAVLYLQRAEELLRPAALPESPRTVERGPRLIAWQRRRVLDHIETRLAMPLRNRELALLVGFSEFHFNVAFRNSLGASPHEFVIRRRIERAQQLMLSTGLSLADVACECGLADQAHLSRLFRKIVGETPAAWRRCRVNESAGIGM
jgi:transcriptional regulator GlxA family with amidase domain